LDTTIEGNQAPGCFLPRAALGDLFQVLLTAGYQVVGPTIDQGAIIYRPLTTPDELPRGWTDEQGPGLYRLKKRDDDSVFGYAVGPHSWKRFLFPPQVDLMRSRKTAAGWDMEEVVAPPTKYAFLGVRACELAAIAIQDRVFITPEFADSIYQQRREQSLIIAVNCTTAADTCFCSSMGTGPRCTQGFDLGLTEVADGFVVEIGSELGRSIADQLPGVALQTPQAVAAEEARQQCADSITRRLDQAHIQARLKTRLQHPQWDDVAERCLSCANCTMVCPTCFCTSVDDVTNLTDEEVLRQRRWDSCFNFDFSHVSGGPVRDQTRSRYRQWLTHKLTHWMDQFGTAGCVGCGRCIAWCPVGIDLTVEATTICGDVQAGDQTASQEVR
jgi:sulfhydrogenase subunit beta (sulfur reductase)